MGHASINMVAQAGGSGHSMKHQAMKHHMVDQAPTEKATDQASKQASQSIEYPNVHCVQYVAVSHYFQKCQSPYH
jgi:hypothetical protein